MTGGGCVWRFPSIPTLSIPPAVSPALDTSTTRDPRAGVYLFSMKPSLQCHLVVEWSQSCSKKLLYLAAMYAREFVALPLSRVCPPRRTACVHRSWFCLLARTWADDLRFPCSIIPSHSTRVLHPLATSSNLEFQPRYHRIGNQPSQIRIVEACTVPSTLHI